MLAGSGQLLPWCFASTQLTTSLNTLSFHVIDLTSRLGTYAKEQLGVSGESENGCWTQVRSSRLPHTFVVNWQQSLPGVKLMQTQPYTVGIAVLIGPGSLSRLPELNNWLAQSKLPVWFLTAPSAIIEEAQLKSSYPPDTANKSLYSLPNSDPKTLWFVLMELFVKAGEDVLRAAGFLSGFNGDGNMPISIKQAMEQAMTIDGAMAAALVDYRSGMCLAQTGSALNLDLAAAGNTQVVRAKLETIESLGLRKGIEDILITLVDQYHLIRLAPNHPGLFLYLVLDKNKGNLALARYKLTDIERGLQI